MNNTEDKSTEIACSYNNELKEKEREREKSITDHVNSDKMSILNINFAHFSSVRDKGEREERRRKSIQRDDNKTKVSHHT